MKKITIFAFLILFHLAASAQVALDAIFTDMKMDVAGDSGYATYLYIKNTTDDEIKIPVGKIKGSYWQQKNVLYASTIEMAYWGDSLVVEGEADLNMVTLRKNECAFVVLLTMHKITKGAALELIIHDSYKKRFGTISGKFTTKIIDAGEKKER